ncbi:aquaporin-like protein [Neofusicoccum parvum]|uniref:Aquaporin-like protein n=1 Tax=Neofusicoccum parvum TaxID=310453 RepID=A0ACB5SDE8_9PEZI|nr:aquaporin-like protein [Neofusicoccum parvum]GME53164.1 aquaporin-like protein [Neofusicoccum parvum]
MGDHLERLQTLEVGATDAVQKHYARHVVERRPVSQRKLDFEHKRPRWLREMAAEATGVFFYVYPGIAATASFFLNETEPAFGSLLQIGFAYAFGIAFAIITSASTSGGHFNPAITICFAIWQGFPWKKVPMYIFAQVFGAFMAGLILMGQYHEQISAYTAASVAKTGATVYNGGPASILCTFPGETQHNLGYLFLIEFFVDSYIGIVIWSALDPANPFISPASAPFVIGFAYAAMVWGFADISISTNLARDLGTRIVAAIFFGGEAFSYRSYSWIAILVNVPATIFATCYYELVMRDSLAKLGTGRAVHEHGDQGLQRHLSKTGVIEAADGSAYVVGKSGHGGSDLGVEMKESV